MSIQPISALNPIESIAVLNPLESCFIRRRDQEMLEYSPFISKKKIEGHSGDVYDAISVTYPDGQIRVVTCCIDNKVRIFNLEEEICEKIIDISLICCIHFYKEEQVLMTLDYAGKLIIWKLFPEIKIIRKIEIAKPSSLLWRLTQVSSTDFFCCVNFGASIGSLFKIKFNFNSNNNNNIWIFEEIEYPTLDNKEKKEGLGCIHQLISKKNVILFSGGANGIDYTVKSIDLNNNNKFQRFPIKHTDPVNCLTSYINNSKNEEIILSGSKDGKIIFWNVEGEYLKEIELERVINRFLCDFSKNTIFVASHDSLYSFSINTERVLGEKTGNSHEGTIIMKWITEENQNRFITCSADIECNIYELMDHLVQLSNINKTYDCLEGMADCKIKFRNKNITFWNTFISNEISEKERIIREFEQIETNLNEKTLFLIILGKEVKIPLSHLPDYYFFFKKLNLKHCVAAINRKIEEKHGLEEIYFLFKDFCLRYENDIIKSWFSDNANIQKMEKIQNNTFHTSFALSLFNKLKNMQIEGEESENITRMCEKDIFFGPIWYWLQLGDYRTSKSEMISLVCHKDFGIWTEEMITVDYFFMTLCENRNNNNNNNNINLTLISTDKKEFKVHKEILILQYDFFFLLFRFGGLEVTEYEKTGKITLVDLMSSDVVEILIFYAYHKVLRVKNKEISAISTFCKLLIFCDQFNEKQLMRKVRFEFKDFVSSYEHSVVLDVEKKKESEKKSIFKILDGLSNYLVGNEKILGIVMPMIAKLGVGVNDFFEDLVVQKEEFENEKKKLQERILELEKLVGEINEKDDKGVGEGQIRVRENDEEEDEEIKKEQPKRKKRKINKK